MKRLTLKWPSEIKPTQQVFKRRNNRNGKIQNSGYTIIFGGDDKGDIDKGNKPITAGVAIAIKKQWGNNIIHVNRINSRIIAIRPRKGMNLQNISILNTYAPDANPSAEE